MNHIKTFRQINETIKRWNLKDLPKEIVSKYKGKYVGKQLWQLGTQDNGVEISHGELTASGSYVKSIEDKLEQFKKNQK